tara:strand:- start:130 stop:243 length:114 start_codon:yes stop_codon:yes gene_type:complete
VRDEFVYLANPLNQGFFPFNCDAGAILDPAKLRLAQE